MSVSLKSPNQIRRPWQRPRHSSLACETGEITRGTSRSATWQQSLASANGSANAELLPAAQMALHARANGLQHAFLHFDARRGAARRCFARHRHAVIPGLLECGDHTVDGRIVVERLHEL